jgi:drug/metabolite transporter (DMT)-like permease
MGASKLTRQLLPVLSLLATATMWGLVWYPLRLLEAAGMAGLWASLTSYGAALLPGLIWAALKVRTAPGFPLAFTVMTLAVGWCNVAFVLAVLEGTIVRVLLLFYLAPLWALLLGWLLLGEKPRALGGGVFVLSVAGAFIMLWDARIGMPWPSDRADWLAVSSGFTFALSNVMLRRMSDAHIGLKAVASWFGVVLVAAVWIALGDVAVPQVNVATWTGAVALGWFGFLIMTLLVIYGVTHMPVHRSAVILLFELVVGAVSSLMLTDETVRTQEWIGGGLILLSAYLAAHEHVSTT